VITNRQVLFAIGVLAYIGENMYFGWNMKPQSFAELWWDNLCINLFVFSMLVPKGALIRVKVVKKEGK
jgi:hypothetical protein